MVKTVIFLSYFNGAVIFVHLCAACDRLTTTTMVALRTYTSVGTIANIGLTISGNCHF